LDLLPFASVTTSGGGSARSRSTRVLIVLR
jgi:hypothetical protein